MTTSPRFVSLLCIAALALVMGIGIAFTSKLVTRVEPSPHDLGGATPDLSAVLERIDRLEQRLAEVEQQEVVAPTSAPRAALPDTATAELARRIEQLERAATRRRGESHEDPAPGALGPVGQAQHPSNEPTAAEQIAAHHQTILDGTKTEQEKVQALRGLRYLGKDAWSDSVVQEMARIGLGSNDASIRADVWRQLHSSAKGRPAIVPSLLLALANDPDATVREEAAETLELFKDDPAVAQSLQSASTNDAEERVRNQAASSLHTNSRRR